MVPPAKHRRRGFNLVEVVVALGIFAVAILAVVGLMSPVSRMMSETLDDNTASRLTSAINLKINSLGYRALVSGTKGTNYKILLNLPPINFSSDTLVALFANKAGDKIALANDAIWNNVNSEKYYEILIILNTTVVSKISQLQTALTNSDTSTDALAAVPCIVRITWPAYLPDGTGPTTRTTRSLLQYNYAQPR